MQAHGEEGGFLFGIEIPGRLSRGHPLMFMWLTDERRLQLMEAGSVRKKLALGRDQPGFARRSLGISESMFLGWQRYTWKQSSLSAKGWTAPGFLNSRVLIG